ncbi:MAG: hypothetical protein ACKV19_12150 [Verrucomicrobiales bacterium]
MNAALEILLRIAGAGLVMLAFLHIPIGRKLRWREDGRKLNPENEQVFHVHTFFVCLTVILMALPCLIAPSVFLVKSEAGMWVSGSLAFYWGVRLYCQFFVYRTDLWTGKRLETLVHCCFAMIWLSLTSLFGACLLLQLGWIG